MHYAKYTKAGLANLMAHFERNDNENRNYENKDIDKSKTYLNYDLNSSNDDYRTGYQKYKDRLDNVYHINRDDVNTLVSIVITLPKDYNGKPEDFFKNCKEFFDNRYGAENCVGAYVHMDEKSPHMHYIFLPVMPNKDFGKNTKSGKYKFRLNAKKVISKTELQRAHPDLQKFLREKEPTKTINIITGAVAKNKENISIEQLKQQSIIKDLEQKKQALEQKERELEQREKEITEKSIKAREELKEQNKKVEPIQKPQGKETLRSKIPLIGQFMQQKTYNKDDIEHLTQVAKESQERELKAKQALYNTQHEADEAKYNSSVNYNYCVQYQKEVSSQKEEIELQRQTIDTQAQTIKRVNQTLKTLQSKDKNAFDKFMGVYHQLEREEQRQKEQQKQREKEREQQHQRHNRSRER